MTLVKKLRRLVEAPRDPSGGRDDSRDRRWLKEGSCKQVSGHYREMCWGSAFRLRVSAPPTAGEEKRNQVEARQDLMELAPAWTMFSLVKHLSRVTSRGKCLLSALLSKLPALQRCVYKRQFGSPEWFSCVSCTFAWYLLNAFTVSVWGQVHTDGYPPSETYTLCMLSLWEKTV